MSKIKDILSIELENDIKNVIDLNSQNEEDIKDELDGFILTESLAKHLSDFLDVFCSDMKESGVWLSGFYGSGKSYFAKMIGFLIANPVIKGTPMRDRFMPKLIGLKNKEIIENQIRSLDKTDYAHVLGIARHRRRIPRSQRIHVRHRTAGRAHHGTKHLRMQVSST